MVAQMQQARVEVTDVFVDENNVPAIKLMKTGTMPVKVNVWSFNSTEVQWDLNFSGRMMKDEMTVTLTTQDFAAVAYGPLGVKGTLIGGMDFPVMPGSSKMISSLGFRRAKIKSPVPGSV